MKSDREICNETSYPHDSAPTKSFVVKKLPMLSMPITTNVVSLNIAQARCTRYTILCDTVCQWLAAGKYLYCTEHSELFISNAMHV
jgi:hypothetical protein